ncbi:hypothetical protein KC217_23700, partial [Mycobacterium tuberculosis]|nr:hypothetical protein [Mycobacterium tuberculosis]
KQKKAYAITVGLVGLEMCTTFVMSQKEIKKNLAYSTMSQLGYMMLALGMGSYRGA